MTGSDPITAAELAREIGEADADGIARAERLLTVANEMVKRYAPAAPAAMKREAIIRYAGYMAGSDYGGIVKEGIGPRDVEYVTNHANAWRSCGAAGLLSRWRARRAGAIG